MGLRKGLLLLPWGAMESVGARRVVADETRSRMSFYTSPPSVEVSLDEFEDYCTARLRVLRAIATAKARDLKPALYKDVPQRFPALNSCIEENLPLRSGKMDSDYHKDEVSHWLVRMAYCQTDDLRRWFLDQECTLLAIRLQTGVGDKHAFFKENCQQFHPISREDYVRLASELDAVLKITHPGIKEGQGEEKAKYYKVPFERVPELVGTRRVFVQGGHAYVHDQDVVTLVVSLFRARLSEGLMAAFRAWPALEQREAGRLYPLLRELPRLYEGPDFLKGGAHSPVSLAQLNAFGKQSFPPCMYNLYTQLQEDHHLKHDGRIQLGLFLKGIGLSLEDSLTFWRDEFTKIMPSDRFEKSYAYNIRHNYGKEGKRTDYTPFACTKIIMSSVGAGQHHGCPFRHFDEARLRSILRTMRCPEDLVGDIVTSVQGHNYQVACSKCFAALHPGSTELVVMHPNQFFDASRTYIQEHTPASTSG